MYTHIYTVTICYSLSQEDLLEIDPSLEQVGDDDEVRDDPNGMEEDDDEVEKEIRGPSPPPARPNPGPSTADMFTLRENEGKKESVSQTLKKLASTYQEKRIEQSGGSEPKKNTPKKGVNIKKLRKEGPIDVDERERTLALNKMVDAVQGAIHRGDERAKAPPTPPTPNDLWCDVLKTQLQRMSGEVCHNVELRMHNIFSTFYFEIVFFSTNKVYTDDTAQP